MPAFSATDYRVELGGINMSTFCKEVNLDIEVGTEETTTFGSGWRSHIAGLREASASITLNDDFATTTVDDRLWGWFGTTQNLRLRPTSGAISATNPEYRVDVIVTGFNGLAGDVGSLAEKSVSLQPTGPVTRVVV